MQTAIQAQSRDAIYDLSGTLTKMQLGQSTPRGLGHDGGQWVYTSAKTRRIGLSQAEYDNIIRNLFASSYSFGENAAPRSKADLAILEHVEFDIDLEAIINHVKSNAPLPTSWPFRRRVKDQVTPMLERQRGTLFPANGVLEDKYDSWSPPDPTVAKDSSVIETARDPHERDKSSEGSHHASPGPDNNSQVALADAIIQEQPELPKNASHRHKSRASDSSDSEAEALGADSSPTRRSSRNIVQVKNQSIAQNSTPVPAAAAAESDTATLASTAAQTNPKSVQKKIPKTIGDHGRVLFSIKIQHLGTDHEYHCCENDDPHLIARELSVKYKDTLEITESWKDAFFSLFAKKLKKLNSAARIEGPKLK